MHYILAIDQGTTSSRAMVFTLDGVARSSARVEHTQLYPAPGLVEHDPASIWEGQTRAAREAISSAGLGPSDIAAVGVANQRETTVVWDRRTGEAVYPAIVWQDRRTAEACHRLRQRGLGELIRERTGLQLDPYFSATKLRWILDHMADGQRRARDGELAFGTIDSFLLYRMTAGRLHVTDVSNASRTLMMNLRTCEWDDGLLRLFDIPAAILPRIVDSSGDLGMTVPDWLGWPVPIRGIAGDQQAALLGQACLSPGYIKCTYGTGCFLLGHNGDSPARTDGSLLTTVAWRLRAGRAVYAVEGSIFVAGAAVQFLRDCLGVIRSAAEIESLASSVADSGGVTFIPALTGLGAPHWNPGVKGMLSGLTRGTTPAHIARATLDAIAHQVADVCEAMSAQAAHPPRELRVDGGASCNDLLLQRQADLLGLPVVRTGELEATALGAARLAALGAGLMGPESIISVPGAGHRRFEPRAPRSEVERQRQHWKAELDRARLGCQDPGACP